MIAEDQARVVEERQRLTAEQAGEWGLEGEEYVDGETMEDVLQRVEEVNTELLRRVAALEHGRENPIVIPDSPEALPVRPPFVLGPGSVLIPINDDVDDKRNQMITEDQARLAEGRQRLTAEQTGEDWEGLVGEEYEDGETMEDVLQRVEARDVEVPRYPPVPGYDDPYVPDVQE